MHNNELFVGIPFEAPFEKQAKLFPLFELEKIEKGGKPFLGKRLESPTSFSALEHFEAHVASVLKRVQLPVKSLLVFAHDHQS